jgi:mRNA interferase MazF
MEPLAAGAVVLIRFPFSDLSRSKLRPAVVLADVLRGDFILCQVTSNPYGDPTAVPITEDTLRQGSLHRPSHSRPAKLFTANATLFAGYIGSLQAEAMERIVEQTVNILQSGGVQ